MHKKTCLRGRKDCEPLANVISDDETTFVCCGFSDPKSRTVQSDCYRLCFKSLYADDISDNDEYDLLDLISVISTAIATKRRLENGRKGHTR